VGDQEPEPEFTIFAPPEVEAGVYANRCQAWHSRHEFTLDFCVSLPPEPDDDEGPVVPYRVVSRIKVPVTLIFEVLQRINEAMTGYEAEFGVIRGQGE
jgi:hypothetical protein